MDLEDLKNKQRDEIRALLLVHSRDSQQRAVRSPDGRQGESRLACSTPQTPPPHSTGLARATASWSRSPRGCETRLRCDVPTDALRKLHRDELEQTLCNAVEDRYRPEMRRMERALLLSWSIPPGKTTCWPWTT